MEEHRTPLLTARFLIVEAFLLYFGVAAVATAVEAKTNDDPTACVVDRFSEYDPMETGRLTIVCPAEETTPSAEQVTLYVDRGSPEVVTSDSELDCRLAAGVVLLVLAVIRALADWWKWRNQASRIASTAGKPHAAAWRSDPAGRHLYRYWTGSSWTDFVSEGGEPSVDPMTSSMSAQALGG